MCSYLQMRWSFSVLFQVCYSMPVHTQVHAISMVRGPNSKQTLELFPFFHSRVIRFLRKKTIAYVTPTFALPASLQKL